MGLLKNLKCIYCHTRKKIRCSPMFWPKRVLVGTSIWNHTERLVEEPQFLKALLVLAHRCCGIHACPLWVPFFLSRTNRIKSFEDGDLRRSAMMKGVIKRPSETTFT